MKFLLVMLMSFSVMMANTNLGQVVKLNGSVKLLKADSIKKSKVNLGDFLYKNDMLITLSKARAVVMLSDGSKVILDPKSKLKVLGKSDLEQEEGKIYYHIKKRSAKGLKVKTNFAIIGVKGTKFIVSDDTTKAVSLKEGLVGVDSVEGAFEHHKQREMDEFAAYQAKQNGEFEKYKKELNEAFVEYVNSFDLKPGKTVSFNGKRADEVESEATVMQAFSHFEKFE